MKFDTYFMAKAEIKAQIDQVKEYWTYVANELTFKQYRKVRAKSASNSYFDLARAAAEVTTAKHILWRVNKILEAEPEYRRNKMILDTYKIAN